MTPVTTTTTNTKTVFQKAPFRVLATLILIQGVMIGQVLLRPAAAQTGAAENCNKISVEAQRIACWVKKAKAGEKNLTGANLSGADLAGVNLRFANLTGANLYMADLSGANLSAANLGGAKMTNVDLEGAKLRGANLSKADLRGANLSKADLSLADLRGVNLSQTHLYKTTNLDGIKTDKDTKGL
ncbi:pentapeptide repeat-containing protein [Armatimonas sp.]|uniref:pentapeptide repeat-containing protein n=1 Tax=Armatimonas sp. TaxID=1872638 RepID=UPI00286C23F1|nr:pentapeptide repeat-containing protein [Armatimonas sp.]